ncbi:MAG: hypothetical protein ACREHD_00080, partial [Pirellulales bacterium]
PYAGWTGWPGWSGADAPPNPGPPASNSGGPPGGTWSTGSTPPPEAPQILGFVDGGDSDSGGNGGGGTAPKGVGGTGTPSPGNGTSSTSTARNGAQPSGGGNAADSADLAELKAFLDGLPAPTATRMQDSPDFVADPRLPGGGYIACVPLHRNGKVIGSSAGTLTAKATSPTPQEIAEYNQRLLDYYRGVMQQVLVVGRELSARGAEGLQQNLPWYALDPASVTGAAGNSGKLEWKAPDGTSWPFTARWDELEKAIEYFLANYKTVGLWGVDVGGWSLKGSENLPGVPGMAVGKENFYGPTDTAIQTFLHEVMHDLYGFDLQVDKSGVWPLKYHSRIRDLVFTEEADPTLKTSWDILSDFLLHAKTIGGKSIWDAIREMVGPKPEPPVGSGIPFQQ